MNILLYALQNILASIIMVLFVQSTALLVRFTLTSLINLIEQQKEGSCKIL